MLPKRRVKAFTLIEVLVALVVGSLLVASARQLLDTVAYGTKRLEVESSVHDRQRNGELTVRALVRTLHPGTPDQDSIIGGPDSVTFSSWCEVPQGWQERCRVTLRLHDFGYSRAIHVRTDSGLSFAVDWQGIVGPFLYLWQSGEDRVWRQSWIEESPPSAIGIVRRLDTLLLPIVSR
jgi:prepilin-type N-terminal cleavage/methylation domain-containing protein